MSARQLVITAMLVAFSERTHFNQTYDANLQRYDEFDLMMDSQDGGCTTIIKIKSDVEQLADFFDECDEGNI